MLTAVRCTQIKPMAWEISPLRSYTRPEIDVPSMLIAAAAAVFGIPYHAPPSLSLAYAIRVVDEYIRLGYVPLLLELPYHITCSLYRQH